MIAGFAMSGCPVCLGIEVKRLNIYDFQPEMLENLRLAVGKLMELEL